MSIDRCATAVALLLITPSLAAQWQSGTAVPLLQTAVHVRAVRDSASALTGWRALAEGTVRFSLVIDHSGTPIEREVRVDELKVEVYGEAPNRSKQQIVAWRDSVLFPNTLRYHRDHLGIVASDFGPIIRLGEGDEVQSVLHPLSPSGLAWYEFQLGDTVVVHGPQGTTRVVAVSVRPRDPQSAGAVGTLYLDVDRGTLVRFRFSFTAASYRDATVAGIAVELESALIDGTTWLPWRQSIMIRRTDPRFGTPLGSLLRADWEIGDYQLGLHLPLTTFRGAAIAGPTTPGFGRWDRPFILRESEGPEAFDVAMSHARDLLERRALSGAPALTVLGTRGVSGIVRVDRVQGVRLGSGMRWSATSRQRLDVDAGIGTATGLLTGGITLTPTPGTSGWHLTLDRRVIDLDDMPRRSTLINSLATVVSGNDLGTWRLRDRAAIGGQLVDHDTRFDLDLSLERHTSLSSHFTALNGVRHPNLAVGYGDVTALSARLQHRNWVVDAEYGRGDATWRRLAVSGHLPLPLGLEATVRGGIGSNGMPRGRGFTLGGIGTLPGLDDRLLAGRRFWWSEIARPIPLRVPIPGLSRSFLPVPLVSELTPFVAIGGVSRPFDPPGIGTDRSRGTVLGLRMTLGDPIARVSIGWHPGSGGVLVAIDAAPLWWPLL